MKINQLEVLMSVAICLAMAVVLYHAWEWMIGSRDLLGEGKNFIDQAELVRKYSPYIFPKGS
ncbi:MAG: hypothetical protein EB015_14380 [Methylocystaceae bacterium]|jgi:hypothetical protein|nr:hypothetical protein [Methylocystaceae bacterium]